MKCNLPDEYKKKKKANVKLTMYDLNKQMVAQMPPLNLQNKKIVDKFNNAFVEFIENTKNKYYMFLCRELNYFTLFNKSNEFKENMCDVIKEIINNYGTWITWSWAQEDHHDCIEFWAKIKIQDKEEVCCFMLFSYDDGVVEVC